MTRAPRLAHKVFLRFDDATKEIIDGVKLPNEEVAECIRRIILTWAKSSPTSVSAAAQKGSERVEEHLSELERNLLGTLGMVGKRIDGVEGKVTSIQGAIEKFSDTLKLFSDSLSKNQKAFLEARK